MSKLKAKNVIESAIAKADSSYFFEDYNKQAHAVLDALDRAGFALMPKEVPPETFLQASNEMRTGRLKPDEHVKDVYQVMLRLLAAK